MIRVGSQKGTKGEYVIDSYFKQNIENALNRIFKTKTGINLCKTIYGI